MKIQGAQYLIKRLEQAGIDCVFGYPGGAIMPVYDALVDSSLKHYLCRHEQAAALAADGYARASGKLGVCIGTSGPGATNLLTGIANAYLDSVPMLIITGQVASPLIGTDAFQEVDVLSLSLSICKHSYLVESVDELPNIIDEAISLAQSGRPGPVLIDIPKDIQMANFLPILTHETRQSHSGIHSEALEADWRRIAALVSQSEKPLVYHGGGIQLAGATEALVELVEQLDIPAVHTLKGIGNLPTTHRNNIGMLGMHGCKSANNAIQECDLLIVLGARFDDRATGKLAEFAPHAKVIHADTDLAEISKLRQADAAILGDLDGAIAGLKNHLLKKDWSNWTDACRESAETHAPRYDYPYSDIHAPSFLNRLSQQAPKNTIITCDVGQHQMWVAQHCQFERPNHHLSSGGLGTMGFGLPAAIGATLACPEQMVINISGDGSFMMNLQELATIKRYKLPVKLIIIDNQSLGMVRQWQELFFAERFSEIDLSDNPDFTQIAECFGLKSARITSANQIDSAIDNFLNDSSAFLLQVCIDPKANVWPLVPPGANNSMMMEGSQA